MKLLFDENLGKPLVKAINNVVSFEEPQPELIHLLNFMGREGSADDEWIPAASAQGWMIITGDKGRRKPKLPEICVEYNVKHIIMSPRLNHMNQASKAQAIIGLWPQIKEAYEGEGLRYRMRKGSKHPILVQDDIS